MGDVYDEGSYRKNNPTLKVTLNIPAGFTFEQYEPVQGWTFSEQKDASGHVTTVTWTATGEGILPGQFQEFKFVAQNPKSQEKAAWDAYQYYKDGSIVEWTGPEGAQTPHSFTVISTPAPSTDKSSTVAPSSQMANMQMNTSTQTGNNTISLILSALSILRVLQNF